LLSATSIQTSTNQGTAFPPARQSSSVFAFKFVMSNLDYSSASTAGTDVAAFGLDPEFKAEQQAFYYVRVLEIPPPALVDL